MTDPLRSPSDVGLIPACRDCYHYSKKEADLVWQNGDRCLFHHPRTTDPVSGEIVSGWGDTCRAMRKPITRWHFKRCGTYGRFFLARTEVIP